MSIKIFTMTHKKFHVPEDKIYVPLHVGRENADDLGYLGDHTGDSISHMNCNYSELTGMYWIWKNYHESDYVGVCHYRRYLINTTGRMLNELEYNEILKEYDMITSKRLQYDFSYYDGYAEAHNIHDLIETGKVIQEKYPEYYPDYDKLVHANESYFGNIMVTSKPLFDEYASWMFDILFEVQRRISVDSYDDYHKRVFGFISEFLLLVWVTTRKLNVYECMVGMTEEKYETGKMKERLAGYFYDKDIQGAKEYFIECIKKRPDVLLKASDITGELQVSMQVITTCDNEEKCGLQTVIQSVNKFKDLMSYFIQLNGTIGRYMSKNNSQMDIDYLQDNKVSYIAIEIAVKILCLDNQLAIDTLQRIASDMRNIKREDICQQLIERCREYD